MSSADQERGSAQHVAFQMTEKDENHIEKDEESPAEKDSVAFKNGGTTLEEAEEARDQLPFLHARQSRFSTVSSPGFLNSRSSFGGMSSRPSFGGISFGNLSSRPSMASLRSTISRVNSELYPERGSFVGYSLGHSLADLPTLARKMYIITQVGTT